MSHSQSHTNNNTMIMQYPTVGSATLTSSSGVVTTVDCQKQVRSWRLLRSLMELLIPSCNCTFVEESDFRKEEKWQPHHQYHQYYYRQPTFQSTITTTTITGTIFGSRRGKVSFCIQSNHKYYSSSGSSSSSTITNTTTPIILLLELAISTATLAREMKGGLLRIALESCNDDNVAAHHAPAVVAGSSLLSTPVWNMYCNGREVGLAVKRKPSKADVDMLQHMESVSVGAGIISGKEIFNDQSEDVLYMRGKYERIQGSSNSESFHLMDPDGNVGQELSFFFLRSH